MTCERKVRGIRPRVLFPVRPRERPASSALVKRDKVIVLAQSGVPELRVEPCRVEEKGMQ